MGRRHGRPQNATSPTAGSPASEPAGTASAVDELVQQGTQAIEEYDYELARAVLTRAFDLSGGAEAPARPLLTLLVDHLAADREALGLAERLSPAAQASPELRLLLALAAARCGERARARALLARAEGATAAEIFVALAAGALAAGEVDEATRLCDDARSRDPAHPGARDLAREVARAREEARRPLDAEVARALGEGAIDEARRLAEGVLARFPESEIARRAVRVAADQQRAREAERLVDEAADGLARADVDGASDRLRRARATLAASPGSESLSARIDGLEADARERALGAKVDVIVRRLAEPDLRPGLLLYASLHQEDVRRRVREASGLPLLDGLERLLGRRSEPQAAVGAVLALAGATAMAEQQPEAALAKLAPHARALAGLAEVSSLENRLRERILDDRRRRLAELLVTARAALDGGDAQRALQTLAKADLRDLGAAERDNVEALGARARTLLDERQLEASYERLLRTGDPLGAREVAEQLLGRAAEAVRERRQAQVTAATAEARRAFGVWASVVDEGAGGAASARGAPTTIELGAPVSISDYRDEPLQWLDLEARSLAVVECCDRWVFVCLADLASGRVRARAVVRVPEPLDYPVVHVSRTGALVIAGCSGAVLELSLATWNPMLWRASSEIAPPGEVVDHIIVAPETRLAWVDSRPTEGSGHTRVVDLERRRVVRVVSKGWWFEPIVGPGETRVVCVHDNRDDTQLSVHDPRGAVIEGGRIDLPADVRAATVHPSGRGLFVLVGNEEGEEEEEDKETFGYVEVDPAGRSSPPVWLRGTNPSNSWTCATSLAERVTFVVAHADDDRIQIHALRAGDGPMKPLFRAELPAFAWLVHDPRSRHVVALIADHERLHVAPLGQKAPALPAPAPEPGRVPALGLLAGCERAGPLTPESYGRIREFDGKTEAGALERMRKWLGAGDTHAEGLLDTYEALRSTRHQKPAAELLRWMKAHRPTDPHTALVEAAEHANDGRWAEVRERLGSVDLSAIVAERRQHAYHLLGLALHHVGEPERAAAVLEEGLRGTEGCCELRKLLDLTVPLNAAAPPEQGVARSSPIREIREAVHDADACLLRGDLAGASAAIDRPVVWSGEEAQSLGRLAELHLRCEPEGDAGRFRHALALARFLKARRVRGSMRRDLPLPGATWPAERLTDLEERAQAWLEALGTPPVAAPPAPEAQSAPVADAHGADGEAPAWSLALRELDAALEAIETGASPKTPARLAFRVRHQERKVEGIDTLLQRSLRDGRFSSGQVADAGALLAASPLLADEADAAAVAVLTEGIAPEPRTRTASSRARMIRLLGALTGHPRVFLHDRPGEAANVQRGRLGVELREDPDGFTLRFLVGGARWTADEVLAQTASSVAIDVDADALTITLVSLGAAALALLQAVDHHDPVFPPDSLDELRRRLGAIQHAVDLHLPDAISGEARDADSRPVVRLTPLEPIALLVEIGVRPVPGAPFGPPGEGSLHALGASGGVRLSARRDHAAERAAAEHLLTVLPLADATHEGRWRRRVTGEERALALVEALAELGPLVVVEWPKGVDPWRWLGKVTRKELRVRVAMGRDLLGIEGEIEIDGRRVALALLLEAIRQGRRYVIIGPRAFVAIAADLRERLDALRDLVFDGRSGLEAGRAAAPVLADLSGEGPDADATWQALCARVIAAGDLDPGIPAGLRADLRPYQREGFRWLARLAAWGAGACLADDMGLGKTVQALALLVSRAALGPALVVAPLSVTPNWLAECARFAPDLRVRAYRGSGREALLADARPGDLFVAAYGVVARDETALSGVRFATLVLDEAQAIKNARTRRARAIRALQAEFCVALTGTPVENHLGELWSLFRVVSPGLLGSWAQFRERFAAPIEREDSAERRAALSRALRPFLLRRTKEAVLPELPPRIEIDRLVSLSGAERELYETARLAAAVEIGEIADAGERIAVLAWLTRLRRLSCHPRMFDETWTGGSSKLDAFLAIVDELREAGHRALVFSQFTDHLALAREALTRRGVTFEYLDGSTPVEERARSVEAFQRGGADLFLISLKAGGTGLNLTAADHVIHLDPWWNPAVEDQATDRAHRIGQTRVVTVIRLIARGTIEEAVLAMHAEKRDLAERLFEGAEAAGGMSLEALVELVRRGAPAEDDGEATLEEETAGEQLEGEPS
jgi:superfamily II DNA or RNA helicase